ncbi:MAG: sigma-70 family RNA polymerase sigma factor, partial [bacterium]|nr:sigma-70 family RNA polymerase sigma factor [bacterium]
AQDIVQDVYVRALRFYRQFQPGTNIRAWLFKILRNTYINRFRRNARTPSQVGFEDFEHQPMDAEIGPGRPHNEGPEAEFFSRQTLGQIEEALVSLPEKFRQIVILSDVEGFSYKEIADIEDCPLGTVMSRLYRARRMLRDKLSENSDFQE